MITSKTLGLVLLASACAATTPAADNLIFNGGFELGTAGYELTKNLRPSTNPNYVFEGVSIDTTTKASGSCSLRYPNKYAEFSQLFLRGVKLKPATTYTFSLSAKSDVAAITVQALIVCDDYNGDNGAPFSVGQSWQRYSVSFTTPALKIPGDPNPPSGSQLSSRAVYIRLNSGTTGTVWLDDIQLVEGDATAFVPSAEVEIAAAATRDLFVEGDGPVTANLIARNTTARVVHGSVKLLLSEDDGAAPRAVGAYDLMLQPGERREIAFSMPLDRFACATLTPVAQFDATTDVLPAWFATVGKYVAQEAHVNLDTTFCVGTNNGLGNGEGPLTTLLGRNASPDDFLDLYAKMGGRMMRFLDNGEALNWKTCENPQGTYKDSYGDVVVNKLYAHGISGVPVLGNAWIADAYGWPKWLLDVSTKSGNTFLPPDAVWRTHVRHLADRYKDRITHWEVLNEPNGWFPGGATKYVAYLKSAAEELRAADPNARVVGFCPTGDKENNTTLPWVTACVNAGGLNYADTVSFHPYGARSLASFLPADELIAQIRAANDKKRTGVPIWNTEVYHLGNVEDPRYVNVRPRHVAARILTDLGEGLAQSCSIIDEALWRRTLNPGFKDAVTLSRWNPSANFVAYNAFARLLEGAKPATGGKIRIGVGAICYVYVRRDGTPAAACWQFRSGPPVMMQLPASLADARVLDVYGNTVTTADGAFALEDRPQYLLPPTGMTAADFIAALRATPEPAVSCSPAGVKATGAATTLSASVAAVPGRTITKVAFTAGGSSVGNATYSTSTGLWTRSYTAAKKGRVEIVATATDSTGATRTGKGYLNVGSTGTFGNGGQPWTVPAAGTLRIEAEHFDEGGAGAAYHDGNSFIGDCPMRNGGTTDEVDISWTEAEYDLVAKVTVRPSGPAVQSIDPGDWMRYTVKVPATGRYTLRFAATNGKDEGNEKGPRIIAKWNGTEVGSVTISPRTNTWNGYVPFETGADLTAGTGTLELSFSDWGIRLNWFEIGPAPVAGNNAPVITTAEPVTLTCAASGTGTRQLAASDVDGDALTWSIATPPEYGTATVSASGLVTYTAPFNYGSGHFCVVRVEDGRGGAASRRLDLSVGSVNGAPSAAVELPTGPLVAGKPVTLRATAVDPDGLISAVKYFANGTALGSGTISGSGWGVVWTPAAAGTYALTCRATDNKGKVGALSAALNVKVIAAGTELVVTDECGTAAPPERVQVVRLEPGDRSAIQPYGDTTRMIPNGTAANGSATWRVADATAVWLSYALTDGQPGAVTVEASPDGIVFAAVATFGESVGLVSPWHIYDGGVAALPAGTNFVRLTVDSVGAVNSWDSALLWVQIDSVAGGGSATPVVLPADFKVSIAPVVGQGGQFQLEFGPVRSGWTYTPEFCTDLASGNWMRLTAFTQVDAGTQRTITDLSASGARRFYRVRIIPAP